MAVEENVEEESESKSELDLHSAGEMLRHAREQKQISIEDIAKQTRIPQRHLSSIEAGDYGALPGRTYAIGFGKSYARAVGLSDATIGSKLRDEMEDQGHGAYQPETSGYSPANPTSIPPKALALTAAGIAVLVFIGYLVWRTLLLEPNGIASSDAEADAGTETEIAAETSTAPSETNAPAPSISGTVILTATQPVWLKIYDADGERLFEKEMAVGETYTVPSDANGPQILTGRPDALDVTIDGQKVAPLGTAERTISDVGISAAALAARTGPDNQGSDQ